MVPAASVDRRSGAFEGRGVERSLASLAEPAGGSFAAGDFEVPAAEPLLVAADPVGVTVPRWVLYACSVVFAATAVASFFLGAWWASSPG